MLRKAFAGITLLFSMAICVSQQAPSQALTSSAKMAAVVGWAGKNDATTLWPNVNVSDNGATVNGSFNVAGILTGTSLWKVAGSSHAVSFSSDAAGQHALVTGWVYYTGGTKKNVPAIATLNITVQPSGAVTVGIKVVAWFGGALLTTTGNMPVTSVPSELPLFKGSAKLIP